MPLEKQEVYNSLKLLTALRPTLTEPQSQADVDRLIAVMQSKLFVALLGQKEREKRYNIE